MADTIKSHSHEIVTVHSIEEAAAIFRREKFDLIFLDIVPEKDALASVNHVRKSAEEVSEKRIPLIVVTKSFSESSFLLDSGDVDVLLEIPAHSEQLNQVVEQFVGC